MLFFDQKALGKKSENFHIRSSNDKKYHTLPLNLCGFRGYLDYSPPAWKSGI